MLLVVTGIRTPNSVSLFLTSRISHGLSPSMMSPIILTIASIQIELDQSKNGWINQKGIVVSFTNLIFPVTYIMLLSMCKTSQMSRASLMHIHNFSMIS